MCDDRVTLEYKLHFLTRNTNIEVNAYIDKYVGINLGATCLPNGDDILAKLVSKKDKLEG